MIILLLILAGFWAFLFLPDYKGRDWYPEPQWPQAQVGEGSGGYFLRSAFYILGYPFKVVQLALIEAFFSVDTVLYSGYYTPAPEPSPGAYVLAKSRNRAPVEMIIPASSVRFFFDLDGDGDGDKVSWINEKGLILFQDLNNNNRLDNGEELMTARDEREWEPLRALDSNKDYMLDGRDPAFRTLKFLWDKNGNQAFSPSETIPAYKLVRAFILTDVNPITTNIKTTYVDPQTHKATEISLRAFFTSYIPTLATNGHPSVLLHMLFEHHKASVFPTLPSRLKGVEGAEATLSEYSRYPNMRGFSELSDLHAEMYGDPVLKKMVTDFSARTPEALLLEPARTRADLMAILLRWGRVTQIEPGKRGWFVDARILALQEKMTERSVYDSGVEITPHPEEAQELKAQWEDLFDQVRARLLLQTQAGHKLFPGGVTYDEEAQEVKVTGEVSKDYLLSLALQAQSLSAADRRELLDIIVAMMAYAVSGPDDPSAGDVSAQSADALAAFHAALFP